MNDAKMVPPQALIPTHYGPLTLRSFGDQEQHVAAVFGDVRGQRGVLCRLHSACATSELFGSAKCDCREQLHTALEMMSAAGRGVLLYLQQEGRGIGLANKLRCYALQNMGLDTVDANRALGLPDDSRDYSAALALLADLGPASVQLLTNNPAKAQAVEQAGIHVERVPLMCHVGRDAAQYVATKIKRMGHWPATSRMPAGLALA